MEGETAVDDWASSNPAPPCRGKPSLIALIHVLYCASIGGSFSPVARPIGMVGIHEYQSLRGLMMDFMGSSRMRKNPYLLDFLNVLVRVISKLS